MLRPFASSAEACPWNCIKCTAWDPNAWPKTCLTYECVDAGGNCGEDDGGGGGPSYQAPTISHVLTCSNTGSNPSTGAGTGWCIGALSLDLTASDPQGQSVIISGDVNGNTFACPNGQTTCSVPLPEGTGTATYKVDSATGLSASGSTTYQLDVTTPQISGSINGSIGQNGWYVTQTVISAAASDTFSGIASFEVNVDNTGWVPYNDTAFSDGSHTIQFRAYDNAGNLTETPVQPVLVDTLPPTLNAPGSLRLVDALNYQLADATSGLSQLTISIADKDHLQPDVLSNFTVTGNAQDGSFSWDGMLPTSHANAGWYPFTLTVTDMAGHQTSLSGAYEVKWCYLVALGLAPDKSEQKQSASRIYAPGFASVPSSNTEAPAETVLPTESSVEEEIQSASPPPVAISQKPFQGMSVQASFSAGNQSNASQSTNLPASNILWGAAATAVLGATLAEWQKKREEEEAARLAAMRNRGGGDEDEAPSKKKNPGRITYEKMMQQKRIVGALQAEQNAKAAQTQAAKIAKATQADMTEAEKLAVYKQTAGYSARQESLKEYERQKAMEAHRAGERNAVSIPEAYKAQEQAKQNAVDAARWAGLASVAQAKQESEEKNTGGKALAMPAREDDPPTWLEKITNAVGQAWDVTKTTTISAWNLTKTIATDVGNLVVETGKSLAYSFNQTVVPKLNSVFVSTQKALLSAWDDTKNVFIGIKNDIASIPFAIKDAAKENIPIAAEWLYQNRTIPVVTFSEKHPLATKVMTHILNLGIDSEKEKMHPFTDTNPESMTWTDLGKVWLYEYGDEDTIKFDSDAALTKEVMALDGVRSYREVVINNLTEGKNEDIIQQPVEYGVDQFGHSLVDALIGKSGDLFLGSYTVSIVVEPKGNGVYVLHYEVKNPSTWASATRFRDDNDDDGSHDSIVPDTTPRGEGIELGGRLDEIFTWSEEIQIPNGGGK